MTEELTAQPEIDRDRRFQVLQAAQEVAQGRVSRDDLVAAMRDTNKQWDDNDVGYLDSILPEVERNVGYRNKIIESAYTSVLEEEEDPTIASDLVNLMEKRENWGEKEQRVFYGAREHFKKQLREQLEAGDVSKEYAKRLEKKIPIVRDIALGIDLGRRGLYSLATRPFSYEKATKIIEGSEVMETGAMLADEGSPLGQLGKHVRGASRSIYQAATLSPLGGWGIIGGFALSRGNQAITEADKAGLTGGEKWEYIGKAAAIEGSIAGAFQLVGLGGFEKFAAGGITATGLRSFFKQAGIQMAAELVEENITEILDQLNQMSMLPEYQNLTDEEKDKMFFNTLRDTTIQTVLTMGVTTGYRGLTINQNKKSITKLKDTLIKDYKLSSAQATKAVDTALKKQEGKDTFEKALGREIYNEKMKTKEGAALWATNNTDQAIELASIEKPSQAEFQKFKNTPEIKQEDRAEFVKNIRSFLDNTGIKWQKVTEAPQEAPTAPITEEGVEKAPEVVEEVEAVKKPEKTLPVAKDLRDSLGIEKDTAVEDLKIEQINQVAEKFGIEANDVIEVLSEKKAVESVMDTPVSLAQKKTIEGVEYNLYREKDGKAGFIETVDVDTGNMIQTRKYTDFKEAMDAHQETMDAAEPKAEKPEKQKVVQPELFAGPLFEQKIEKPVEKKPKIGKVKAKPKKLGSFDKAELKKNTLTGRILIDEGQFNAKALRDVGQDPEAISESMFRPTQAFGRQMKVVVDEGGIGDIDLWAQEFHDSLVNEGVIAKMETEEGKVDTEAFLDWVFDTLAQEKTALDTGKMPKTLAEPSERAEQAAIEAGRGIDEYIEDIALTPGLTVKKVGKTVSDKIVIPESVSKEVEARWQQAKGIKSPGRLKKISELISEAKRSTRHFPELDPKNPLDARVGNVLRLFQNVKNYTKGLAENTLKGLTAGLGKNKYEIYARNIILADLADDVASGLHDNKDLPFGYANEAELKADLKMFSDIAKANPEIQEAIDKRNKFMTVLKKELVDLALLPKEVLDKKNYFHHQVLKHRNFENKMKIGQRGLESGKRGWQRKRIGSFEDYNTEYVQAEFEVVADELAKIEVTRTLKRLKGITNISESVKDLAKEQGVNYKELIPDGFRTWKPKEGLRLYLANSFSESVLQEVLQGERHLEDADVKKVLAVGATEEWIIPSNIADTFDSLKEFGAGDLADRLARSTLNSWKQWVLLNPYRVIKYNINNMSGDTDISMAYDPRIALQYGWGALKESYKYWRGKGLTQRMTDALKLNVIDSGFAGSEIENISKAGFFKLLTGENPNLVEKYWRGVKGFTQFRENILRLAAFNYFTAERKKGRTNMYGTSNPAEIDAMPDGLEKDAKLARELIGDYGNISKAGEWLRSHMMPFWSFQEINAKRYMRLMANLAKEGRKTGGAYKSFKAIKTTASLSWKAGKLAIFANLLSGMVQLWNHAVFPDEEDELDDRSKREGHILLGRREDGSIRSLRFKGALTEALEWFGAQDFVSDIGDIMKEEATVWDKIAEIPKSVAVKGLSALRPEPKLLYESLTKKSLWPDPTKPSPVRDVTEHVLRAVSLDRLYRHVTGKPMRGLSDEMQSLVFYNTDPGEAAHWDIKNKTFKFLEKKGVEPPSGTPTERANSLYYFKQALRYNDEKAAEKWYDRYIELGGTKKGVGKSIERSSPLGSLPNKFHDEFMESLSKKDLEELKFAEEWYGKKGKEVKSEKIRDVLTTIEEKKVSFAVYDLTDPSGSDKEDRQKKIIEGKSYEELEKALREEYKSKNKPRIKKASNGKWKIGSGYAIYETKESAEEAREKKPRRLFKYTKSRKLTAFGKRLNKLKKLLNIKKPKK